MSLGPYDNNCYILVCPHTKESVIIDTPAEPEKALAEAQGTNVKAILMTHCHMDHVLGHREIKEKTQAPVWVHQSEANQLPLPPDFHFQHPGQVRFGTITLTTIHIPGHTTGGTALLWRDHLFSGDTLFPNGPGRTMTPDNFQQLVKNIQERLFVLPDDVAVHPGHGADTVLGLEKEQYRIFSQRPHPPNLCGNVLWLQD